MLHIWISLGVVVVYWRRGVVYWMPNFSLNWQFWFFWTKFTQKGYFHFEVEKANTTIEFRILELI